MNDDRNNVASTIAADIAEIRRITGVDDIRTLETSWLERMREGVVVSITIRRWRARARLTLADLGIPAERHAEQAVADLLQLGSKMLLPADLIKRMDAVDSSMRKLLTKRAVQTYAGPFLPVAEYAAWKPEHERLVRTYFGLRDHLYAEWESIMTTRREQYAAIARSTFQRLCKLAPKADYCQQGEEAFTANFLSRIEMLTPDRDTVFDSFAVETTLSYIPLPSLLAERSQAARDLERAKERLRQDRLWREISMEDALMDERRRMLEQMNRDVVADARKQKEALLLGFIRDMLGQVRSLFYEAITDTIATTLNNDRLHPRSVVQVKNMIRQAQNWLSPDDTEMRTLIAQANSVVNGRAEREPDEVVAKLRELATVSRASLLALGEAPRSGIDVGVPDFPAAEVVTMARRNLGLVVKTPAVVTPVVTPGRRGPALPRFDGAAPAESRVAVAA